MEDISQESTIQAPEADTLASFCEAFRLASLKWKDSHSPEIKLTFDVDLASLSDERVVDVCMRGSGIDDDVGLDLLQN